jgi:hypothetical protein
MSWMFSLKGWKILLQIYCSIFPQENSQNFCSTPNICLILGREKLESRICFRIKKRSCRPDQCCGTVTIYYGSGSGSDF